MKVNDLVEVFKVGKEVANPEAWKRGTININYIVVLISGVIGIMNMFDCSVCDIQLTTEQVIGVATGVMSVAGIFNVASTAVSSKKASLLPTKNKTDLEQKIKELQK